MRKFNPLDYREVMVNEEIKVETGRIKLLCSMPAAFFITCQGIETLAAVGHEVDVKVAEPSTVRVEVKGKARAFLYHPFVLASAPTGEVLTNPHRTVEESGTMQLIRKELRRMQLQHMADRRKMRAEHENVLSNVKSRKAEETLADNAEDVVEDNVDDSDKKADDSDAANAAVSE